VLSIPSSVTFSHLVSSNAKSAELLERHAGSEADAPGWRIGLRGRIFSAVESADRECDH
jgi:hypothetical protein